MKWFKGLSSNSRMCLYGFGFGIMYNFGKILVGFEPANLIIDLAILFFCCMLALPFINRFDDKYIVKKENDII